LADAIVYWNSIDKVAAITGFAPTDPFPVDPFNQAITAWLEDGKDPQFYQVWDAEREPLGILCGVDLPEDYIELSRLYDDPGDIAWTIDDLGRDAQRELPLWGINVALMKFYHLEANGEDRRVLGLYNVIDGEKLIGLILCPVGLVENPDDPTEDTSFRSGIIHALYETALTHHRAQEANQ
jgi:hypothetical protein